MRTFAQKPKATPQTTSTKSTIPGRGQLGQSPEVRSILHLQGPVGIQAVQRNLQTGADEPGARSTAAASPRFGQDFSRIPIHPPAAGAIQTKLAINEPGDEYEQEADRVSEQVMRMEESTPTGSVPAAIQRNCAACEDEESQTIQANRVSSVDADAALLDTGVALRATEHGGEALPEEVRSYFERRFRHDFSQVRVHADSVAAEAAHAVQARAYTVRNHILFGSNEYAPTRFAGKRLLAHELTHVVQQNGAGLLAGPRATPSLQRQVRPPTPPRPSLQVGTPVRGRCELRSGAFAWAIVPGTGSIGACFNVQIVFFPGRVERVVGSPHPMSPFGTPALGARWAPDIRPVALVQTVAAIDRSTRIADQPQVDASARDTDPFYGARWDQSSGAWTDEPSAVQGCTSLPEASASSGYSGGSRFSRARSYGAVINDSPMVSTGQRKDFQTTAVVMETGERLGSLTWAVEHDGTQAVVGVVECHDLPQRNVQFGTPGHDEMLRDYYNAYPRSVVDGFAANSSGLPPGATAILDRAIADLTRGSHRGVVVSGAATPDEGNAPVLSLARAESVVTYLTGHGVPRTAITVEAYGASAGRQPFGTTGAESANRRVQLTLI